MTRWQETRDEIRDRADCTEVYSHLHPNPKIRGDSARCISPHHDDDDPSMSLYEDGFKCHKCGDDVSGDVFDLWGIAHRRRTEGEEFKQTVLELADYYHVDTPDDRETSTSPAGPDDEPDDPRPAPGPRGDERDWSDVRDEIDMHRTIVAGYGGLARLWNTLDGIDGRARQWLADERGIDPDFATAAGVKSITRNQLHDFVRATDDETLRAAGLATYLLRPDWNTPDDRHCLECGIVFPYFARPLPTMDPSDPPIVDTLRFREAAAGHKVRSPKSTPVDLWAGLDRGAPPHRETHPYLGWQTPDVARQTGRPLYVVEGEIDALSIAQTGRPAVGTTSAHKWRPAWCKPWHDLDDVLILADGDESGEEMALNVRQAALEALGREWTIEHLDARRTLLGDDPADANDWNKTTDLDAKLTEIEREITHV